MARAKIGMPNTAFAASPKDTDNLIGLVGTAPLIVKLLESTQGKGVVLAETKKAARIGHRRLPRPATPTFWCRISSKRPQAKTSAVSLSAARSWLR